MEHHLGHSYREASGFCAQNCSCGFSALGRDFGEVELLMNKHLEPVVTGPMEISLAYLQSQGFDTTGFVEAWNEPQRVYHDYHHISKMIESLFDIERRDPRVQHELERTVLHLAAWTHDIVYVPGAKDNEERSGDFAYKLIAPTSVSIACRVQDIVLATKTHTSDGGDLLCGYIIDADLRGLGTFQDTYRRNSDRVKAEYPGITDEQWFVGRSAFLEGFLKRDHFYFTEWGAPCEAQARQNMENELAYVRRRQSLLDLSNG
jgi:predicted metal-dependent HD superfamily phosphohydrolase